MIPTKYSIAGYISLAHQNIIQLKNNFNVICLDEVMKSLTMQSTKQPSVEASMEDVFSSKKCKHD